MGHVVFMGCMGDIEIHKLMSVGLGLSEGRYPLRERSRRWEDRVKMDLTEAGCVDWIELAQSIEQGRRL